MRQPLTPEQKTKIKDQEERCRRERKRREDEYRRRIERLRRQIEAARKRRQRMLLLFLLAVLAVQESIRATFSRSYIDWPDPMPDRSWTPDPNNDYAPAPGKDDHCDGYSRDQWNQMAEERGIRISRKAELQKAWEADPDRDLFPRRYREWGYKPFVGQIMDDLSEPRWQIEALTALKLMSPPETHIYLDEAFSTDPGDLLMCRADFSADIVKNFQCAAVRWEIHKQKEAEEAKRDKELSRKNDDDQGIHEPK